MEEANDQKEIVTAQEVAKIIQQSAYGEYDQYHDWSPSYTLQNKADLLENMLKCWDTTEEKGRKLIVQYVRTLIKESGGGVSIITDKLLNFGGHSEIVKIVDEFLNSGVFSHALLSSMKNYHLRQDDWLLRIRAITAERKFIDNKRKVKNLYKEIQGLILELS